LFWRLIQPIRGIWWLSCSTLQVSLAYGDFATPPIYHYVNKFQEKPWVKGVLHPPIGAEDFKWAYVEAH